MLCRSIEKQVITFRKKLIEGDVEACCKVVRTALDELDYFIRGPHFSSEGLLAARQSLFVAPIFP